MVWEVKYLKTQDLKNPIGIQSVEPVLSYINLSDVNNTTQSDYRIIVSSSKQNLENNQGDIWDTGKIHSQENRIKYDGKPLNSRTIAYWKVKTWSSNGDDSGWSNPAIFEVGLLNNSDWHAHWIGEGEENNDNSTKVPMLAKDFSLSNQKRIEKARLYISGLGIYKGSINGKNISNTYFDPGESDNRKTVNYQVYDVSRIVSGGDNTIGVSLASGFYGTTLKTDNVIDGVSRYVKWDGIQKAPNWEQGLYGKNKLLVQLEVTYEDGSMDQIISDNTWKYKFGPITFTTWLSGENYDSRLEVKGWNRPGFSRKDWVAVKEMNAPAGKLTNRECPGITEFESYFSSKVTKIGQRKYIVDMGRNGAGIPELNFTSNSKMTGGKIRIFPAEVLNEDGSVNQYSVKGEFDFGEVFSEYTVCGNGREHWEPTFNYYGYRYLEIQLSEELDNWIPKEKNFKNHLLRTNNKKTGFFESSSNSLNMVNTIIDRSIESNMYSTLTDCPHIEKTGWLEVPHLLFDSISASYDVHSWMKKICKDILDAQYDDGQGAPIAPEFQHIQFLSKDPNWGGAIIFVPMNLYTEYGDKETLQEAYPSMKRYISYLESNCEANGLLLNYAQMGDWGGYDTSTSKDFVACGSLYRMLVIMVRVSSLLNYTEDEKYYEDKRKNLKRSINNMFYDNEKSMYDSGSQTANAVALYSGIVDDKNKEKIVKKLVESVKKSDYHLTSGEVGLKQVFSALTMFGQDEVAYRMISNDTMPSYLYFIKNNMTTLPEYWDMSRSQNHCMMGHAKGWLMRSMLGIKSSSDAYRHVEIKPYLPKNINYVKGNIETVKGNIQVQVSSEAGKTIMNVHIPVGTCAKIYFPNQNPAHSQLKVNGKVVNAEQYDGYLIVTDLGSGDYKIKNI